MHIDRVVRLGTDALLVEVPDSATATALFETARDRISVEDVLDIVPAARTVLFDGVADRDALAEEIAGWTLFPDDVAPARPQGESVDVPVVYDGPDLAEVADRWQMSVEEAVAAHSATEFTVAFCGFAPGFAYCTGLAERLHVPRRPDPRTRVPAGSVGLAGEFTGIYPSASPGGWQLIGHTGLGLWDVDRDPPATLPPGTRVRFVPR
ncbi:MAG TPA: 5-oxoprolinase subunit PxpB [Nocardioidaceae bacterium]|nr:5-oxoprolinase subunit PxpB [Nocardioidaceae bacterium]